MKPKDLFHETTAALLSNKVRSGLTILGIVIGIASVIAMLAVGAGASGSIQSSIQSLGSNLLVVSPSAARVIGAGASTGRGTAQSLTLSDSNAISSQVNNILAVAPEVTSRKQVIAGANNTNTTIDGTVSAYTQVRNLTISDGAFFTDAQEQSLARVAVLGPTTAADLFTGGAEPVGQNITINGMQFTVIGVAASKGGNNFNNTDDRVYIPLNEAQLFMTGNQYLSDINIEAASAAAMTQVQNDTTDLLLAQHHISNPANADFSIVNQADILSTASTVTTTLTILLASVAGISLLVGGIGIMNMMLTTVTERTREIGLRKAVGAKKKDISTQFLVESVLLTVVGGIIGIALGCLIALVVALTGLLHPIISISSIVLSFGVSAVIGIAFGYYPARRAANLNPIEALRYE
jgi:putative ABC transport system permease protein